MNINPYSIIPICSLLISCITMLLLFFGHSRAAKTDLVAQLETRVESLERELKDCKEHIAKLEEHNGNLMKENIELLRRIARMNHGS